MKNFLAIFVPKPTVFLKSFTSCKDSFFFFCGEKLKGKKINSHGMEQAKTMSIVHTWMLTKINNQSWLIHCCVIIWNSFYYWAVIWAFQGLICLQTAGYSFLTVWTCQLCNIKLYTHFHSSLDTFFTMYLLAIYTYLLWAKAELLQLKPHPFSCMRNFINKKVRNRKN